nr:MAG TPA: hypothetical protein [Caudoviricetes sp.]
MKYFQLAIIILYAISKVNTFFEFFSTFLYFF